MHSLTPASTSTIAHRSTPVRWATLAAIFLAASLFQSARLGGFSSDLGGDPDEAAHAVTALLVRDYALQGFPASPMSYAQQYYDALPKVALGHYPPGYYLPAALALAIWRSPDALILLQSLLVACLALAAFAISQRETRASPGHSLTAAALVLFHGEIARISAHVMSDLLLALLVLAASWCWLAWLRRPSWRASLAFGSLAAAAILTKGSAIGLAGVPLLSFVLTRRWSDLKRLSWWGAALPVLVIAGPWMAWSVRFTQEGFTGQTPWAFLQHATAFYASAFPHFWGWPLLLLLAASLTRCLVGALSSKQTGVPAFTAVLWSLCLSLQATVMLVPSGVSPRYLVPWLLPAVLLALMECAHLMRRLPRPAALTCWLAVVLLTLLEIWRHQPKNCHGFSDAVGTLWNITNPLVPPTTGQPASANSPNRSWLIASDARGEGAVIAAVAFRLPDPVHAGLRVLRGSKELANTDWVGRHYQSRFSDAKTLLDHLDRKAVEWVMVDLSVPHHQLRPHESQLLAALQSDPTRWEPQPPQPIQRGTETASGKLHLFHRRSTATP